MKMFTVFAPKAGAAAQDDETAKGFGFRAVSTWLANCI
jgi:hypothetical protein